MADIRERILKDPQALLNDREVMRALVSAGDSGLDSNVVDLKSVVMKRLEARLDKMEGHSNHIISAAYDNIASTNHIHRAILELLTPSDFDGFLDFLRGDWAASLSVTVARFCVEAPNVPLADMPVLQREFGPGVVFLQKGEIDYYITLGKEVEAQPMTLRQVRRGVSKIHGQAADSIRSEALLKIDLGVASRPGLLVLSSDQPEQFDPAQAADLLIFYGSVFEKVVQIWLGDV